MLKVSGRNMICIEFRIDLKIITLGLSASSNKMLRAVYYIFLRGARDTSCSFFLHFPCVAFSRNCQRQARLDVFTRIVDARTTTFLSFQAILAVYLLTALLQTAAFVINVAGMTRACYVLRCLKICKRLCSSASVER